MKQRKNYQKKKKKKKKKERNYQPVECTFEMKDSLDLIKKWTIVKRAS
jgi:hypothetical protein